MRKKDSGEGGKEDKNRREEGGIVTFAKFIFGCTLNTRNS